jgi:ABC-2 type transport system ATP-binding protein
VSEADRGQENGPSVSEPPAGSIISVRNLSKRFRGFAAVDGISFDVPEGSIFAFLGPNGAGKSTTIKMLTTLLRQSGGGIMLDGHDPLQDPGAARRSFGIIFQDPSLDDELTARENMEFHGMLYGVPAAARKPKIEELLRFVELWDRKDELVKRFSGGMKRRLEIARGLLHAPRILFLDEPTLGLDPQTRNHVWGYLQEMNRKEGVTVFFTTHYMEEAERVARTIAIIDHGKIIATGTPADLMRRTGSSSLEDAFLALTGKSIREEEAGSGERMRMIRRARGR